MLPWDENQALAFDKGISTAQVAVRILLADEEIYMTTTEKPNPTTPGSGPGWGRGAPIILNMSEIAYQAPISLKYSDQLASVQIEALNVMVPITAQNGSIPSRYSYGKLSDYLSQYTLAGPNMAPQGVPTVYGFRPAQLQVYMSPFDYPNIGDHYFFKGLMYDFEVIKDGSVVIIRAIEDNRWDRIVPYILTAQNFKTIPQDSVGELFPIVYGQHATWHHRYWPYQMVGLNGPFSRYNPLFPMCMNLAPTIKIGEEFSTVLNFRDKLLVSRHNDYMAGCSDAAVGANNHAIFVPVGRKAVSLIDPIVAASEPWTGSEFISYQMSADEDMSTAGQYDLFQMGVSRLQRDYTGYATIIPERRSNKQTPITLKTDNLASLFGETHARRGGANLIDGDVYSWFHDPGGIANGQDRWAVFDMGGNYPYMGAVTEIRFHMCARRRSGTGNLQVYAYLDTYNDQVPDPPIELWTQTSLLTLTPNSAGYAMASGTFAVADPLSQNGALERWDWRLAGTNDPIPLSVRWLKTNSADTWDIIQCSLIIGFTPFKEFLRYDERETTRTVWVENLEGRLTPTVVADTWLEKTYGEAAPPSTKDYFYGGWCIGDGQNDPRCDWPNNTAQYTSWKTLQNPAWILQDMLLTYGGSELTSRQLSWPPIAADQMETAEIPGNWENTAQDLNDAVIEAAAQGQAETFKIACGFSGWNGTRELIQAVCQSIPGLKVLPLPNHAEADSDGTYRPSFACYWHQTGSPVTYRRPINIQTDCVDFSFAPTPRTEVLNEVKLRYGYSTAVGAYVRQLYCSLDLFDHGMPHNPRYGSSTVTDSIVSSIGSSGDYKSSQMSELMDESYQRYGTRTVQLDLPFVFRWHEALAVRNWLLRWYGFQRVRVGMVVNQHVMDLRVGDVFKLSYDSEKYLDCKPPIQQIPTATYNWSYISFLVESINYVIDSNGLVLAKVEAISCDRYGGW